MVALVNPQNPEQILEKVKKRLANGIAETVVKSRDNFLESIKGMIEEKMN